MGEFRPPAVVRNVIGNHDQHGLLHLAGTCTAQVLRRFYRGVPVQRLNRATWLANGVSYALLLALSIAWLLTSVRGG
jgi:hypothetical protein